MKLLKISPLLVAAFAVPSFADDGNAQACRAVYSETDQVLTVPCLEAQLDSSKQTFSYAVKLTLANTSPLELALTGVEERPQSATTECTARYDSNSGELALPCVDAVDATGARSELGNFVFYASTPNSPSVFSVRSSGQRMPRSRQGEAYDGNWDVPFLRQTDYGKAMGESACGPTSVAMLLRFYYPNSGIDMPEIYHSGTQTYQYRDQYYNGGPADGYKNVSWASGKTGTDYKLSQVTTDAYYIGEYAGMTQSYMLNYLESIWGIDTKVLYSIDDVYSAIQNGPLLGHVYGHGNSSWGHYLVIRGIDNMGTAIRTDDYIIVNDPYDVWNSSWDTSGNNKRIKYAEFFVSGARYGGRWFRDAVQLTPFDTAEQREYSLIVDTGHNNFTDSYLYGGGNNSVHNFFLDYPSTWKFYYAAGGDWYYPTQNNSKARWVPRLVKSGNYGVFAKFRGDSQSGKVTYVIYNKNDVAKKTVVVDQYRASATWTYAELASSIYLENGDYVRAEGVPAGTNVDAIKFRYLSDSASIGGEAATLLNTSHETSWGYFRDPTKTKWYISAAQGTTYALGLNNKGHSAWVSMANGSSVASIDFSNKKVAISSSIAQNTPSDKYKTASLVDGSADYVYSAKAREWANMIEGSTVPMDWYFFKVASTGVWYIIWIDGTNSTILRLGLNSDYSNYDWKKPKDQNGAEIDTSAWKKQFFQENGVWKVKFTQ